MSDRYDVLKIKNQLCFPLYACSREVIRKYQPYLQAVDLTYTQYVTMMVLWEHKSATVKELGSKLYLDSGTLTPLLKKLENKGFLVRRRSEEDERSLIVTITDKGEALKDKVLAIRDRMAECANVLSPEEIQTLYDLLYKLLGDPRK